jgi:hypothetical protein
VKRKEMTQLIIAVIILVAAGALILSQLAPKKTTKSQPPTVEKVTPIQPDFDQSSLTFINDRNKNQDFYQPPNLSTGLGNNQPFGNAPQ